MRNSKLFSLAVAVSLFFAITLASCGDGGLPKGRYVPVDSDMTMLWVQAIIIKGNKFKVVYPFEGQGVTLNYKYTDGTLSFSKDFATAEQTCEFKNDTLRFAGISFVKTN